jgi:hypothetical protein
MGMTTHLLAIAVALAASIPANATEPQVGRWAVDTQNCTGGGDTYQTSALTVTPRTVSWASEYCTIGKMYKADRALYIEGRCSKGGLAITHPITLAMKGERLAVTWNGTKSELKRCPGSW